MSGGERMHLYDECGSAPVPIPGVLFGCESVRDLGRRSGGLGGTRGCAGNRSSRGAVRLSSLRAAFHLGSQYAMISKASRLGYKRLGCGPSMSSEYNNEYGTSGERFCG